MSDLLFFRRWKLRLRARQDLAQGPLKSLWHSQDWDPGLGTQPMSLCDSGSPLTTRPFVIRGDNAGCFGGARPARFSWCQLLGYPSGYRLPVPLATLAAGHSRPLASCQGWKRSCRLLSCILSPPLGPASHCWVCNMPNLRVCRLRGASWEGALPAAWESSTRPADHPSPRSLPRQAEPEQSAETVAGASPGSGLTVPADMDPVKDVRLCFPSLPKEVHSVLSYPIFSLPAPMALVTDTEDCNTCESHKWGLIPLLPGAGPLQERGERNCVVSQ